MNNSNTRGFRSIRPWLAALLAAALAAACGGDDGATTSGNVDDTVAAQLVGFWEVPAPGGRWTLDIKPGGSYAFANEGSGLATSHSGTFTARDGEWTLRSVTGIEDNGRYELLDGGGIELTGNRGAVRWARGRLTPAEAGATFAAGGNDVAPQPAFGNSPRPPPSGALAPAGVTAAARPNAAIPETVDPCLLVTAEEASSLLGVAVETQRKTPQPRMQNNCLYRAQGRTFQVRSSNAGGLDPAGFIESRRATGGVPLPGVGDDAVITRGAGITQVTFVIGTASVELVVSGVPQDRADSAMPSLAVQAAQRMTSPSAAYDMGGTSRFVGVWRVRTSLAGGGQGPPDMIVEVKRGGDLAIQTGGTMQGTIEIAGNEWRLNDPRYQSPPSGTYRVRGDELSVDGALFNAQLERVACGKRPKLQPPYEISRDIEGAMRPTTRLAPQIRPPASQSLDEKLVGLWEGAGTLKDGEIPLRLLMSVDSRGYTVFALYPHSTGRLEADDGNYTMDIDGLGKSAGTYELVGGSSDGTIRMKDGEENTLEWLPTDPSKRPVYAQPLVADCG